MSDILVISATRLTKSGFERRSLLASSLRRMSFDARIKASISYQNRLGLPAVFNSRIVEDNRDKILAFTHDDVRFDDYWLSARLDEGLRAYDVIGVAGCRRRYPNQASWAFTTLGMSDIPESLSGAVAHFPGSREAVSYYGQAKRRCKLLDGLLIAVKASALIACGLRFDERFHYDFYDLDFCRAAQSHGLTIGTWPIALTHGSPGSFGSPAWKRDFERYRLKWGN